MGKIRSVSELLAACALLAFGSVGVLLGCLALFAGLGLTASFTVGFALWKLYGWFGPVLYPAAPAVGYLAVVSVVFIIYSVRTLLRLNPAPDAKQTYLYVVFWNPLFTLVFGKLLHWLIA